MSLLIDKLSQHVHTGTGLEVRVLRRAGGGAGTGAGGEYTTVTKMLMPKEASDS